MPTGYNRIAGQSIERIAALSDGIFAVAMTLLVLDLHTPATALVHSEAELGRALVGLLPHLLVYLMSFLTLGIFWVGQQTQLNHFARADRDLAWIHLGFLFAVVMMPFSTALMAAFIAFRLAMAEYWLNVALLGAALFASWRYAGARGLLKGDVSAEICRAIGMRIIVAQALYVVGALLSLEDTRWSIGFIVVLQLNYAIAPRLARRREGRTAQEIVD
jgi:uncharacterized membrane protein